MTIEDRRDTFLVGRHGVGDRHGERTARFDRVCRGNVRSSTAPSAMRRSGTRMVAWDGFGPQADEQMDRVVALAPCATRAVDRVRDLAAVRAAGVEERARREQLLSHPFAMLRGVGASVPGGSSRFSIRNDDRSAEAGLVAQVPQPRARHG